MKPKYTPGPWLSTGNGLIYAETKPMTVICSNPRYPAAPGDEPNMALIAAAPDMYEALEKLVKAYRNGTSHPSHWTDIYNNGRAALAKARGETE